jgi:hypothetical protein
MMKRTVNVVFDGEVLRPEEPLDLEPNGCYQVTIEDAADQAKAVGEPPGILGRIAALARDLDLPPDYSEQLDHYLYGTPKR